jgi:homoserine dehydrogenase
VSVVADVLDVSRARLTGFAGTATRGIQLKARPLVPIDDVRTRYYLRFQAHDRPGVLARLAGALGEASVSIEQMIQEGGAGSSGLAVDIVMLTHEAVERDVQRALRAIEASGVAAGAPKLIRVQE